MVRKGLLVSESKFEIYTFNRVLSQDFVELNFVHTRILNFVPKRDQKTYFMKNKHFIFKLCIEILVTQMIANFYPKKLNNFSQFFYFGINARR